MNATSLTLPGPLFFLFAPLALAALAYLLHRWTVLSGLVATIGSLGLSGIALTYLLGKPISLLGHSLVLNSSLVFLGRSWTLTPASAAWVVFEFLVGGLCFLLALPASQGWAFYPFALAVLGILNMSVTAEQFIYTVLFFWLGAVLTGFVVAGGRPGATMGALRLITISTMATMPLLLLPTFFQSEIVPDGATTGIVLGILGLGMLLMLPPFHGALVGVATFSAPMPPVIVLSILPAAALHIFLQLGQIYPAVLQDGLILDLCQWLGLGAVILGGLAAPAQRRWGSLIGYAACIDWGIGLMALGQGTERMELVVQMLFGRAVALLLCGAGLTPLFEAAGKRDDMERCAGMFWSRPLNVLSLVLGLLILAGLPTPTGVIGRWLVLADLAKSHPVQVWIVVVASVGVGIGALVGLLTCLRGPGPTTKRRDEMIALAFGLLALWIAWTLLSGAAVWQSLLVKTLKV